MFDNPFFTYAGYNNPSGLTPTEISVANTTNQTQSIKLFNAQDNLVQDNQGLPDGVLVNQSAIYEMPAFDTFTCFQPLNGFRTDTTFSIELTGGTLLRYFFLATDVFNSASKVISGGYSGVPNDTLYKLDAVNIETCFVLIERDTIQLIQILLIFNVPPRHQKTCRIIFFIYRNVFRLIFFLTLSHAGKYRP